MDVDVRSRREGRKRSFPGVDKLKREDVERLALDSLYPNRKGAHASIVNVRS